MEKAQQKLDFFDSLLRPQGAYVLLLLEEGGTRFARDGWWRGPGSFYPGTPDIVPAPLLTPSRLRRATPLQQERDIAPSAQATPPTNPNFSHHPSQKNGVADLVTPVFRSRCLPLSFRRPAPGCASGNTSSDRRRFCSPCPRSFHRRPLWRNRCAPPCGSRRPPSPSGCRWG